MARKKFNFGDVISEFSPQNTDVTQFVQDTQNNDLVENVQLSDISHDQYNGDTEQLTQTTSIEQNTENNQSTKNGLNEHSADNTKHQSNTYHDKIDHNAHNEQNTATKNRRYSLIIPENIYKSIKIIASVKQISVNKAILNSLRDTINENNLILSKYKEHFGCPEG